MKRRMKHPNKCHLLGKIENLRVLGIVWHWQSPRVDL